MQKCRSFLQMISPAEYNAIFWRSRAVGRPKVFFRKKGKLKSFQGQYKKRRDGQNSIKAFVHTKQLGQIEKNGWPKASSSCLWSEAPLNRHNCIIGPPHLPFFFAKWPTSPLPFFALCIYVPP